MSDPVLVAILGIIGSGIGSCAGVISQAKLTQYRLEQLEKRVQAHNNFDERLHELERRLSVHDEDFKRDESRMNGLEKRIETLERRKKL